MMFGRISGLELIIIIVILLLFLRDEIVEWVESDETRVTLATE
jgi:hypothetical protein